MEKKHFEIILEHMQSQFKIFGEGLEGLRNSLDGFKVEVRDRFDRLEGRMDRMEGRMTTCEGSLGRIELDIRDIKRTVGLLHAIASDHETRLQNVESKLEDHLTNHS